MENQIYQTALEKVAEGSRFKVDFKQRSLKLDGKYVIKDGCKDGLDDITPISAAEIIAEIEYLYKMYRESVPSERSDNKRRVYFMALPEEKLSDEAMMYGESRETAQVALELYILIYLITGCLKWEDFGGTGWFWKSPNIDGLVIFREWIDPDYKKLQTKQQSTKVTTK